MVIFRNHQPFYKIEMNGYNEWIQTYTNIDLMSNCFTAVCLDGGVCDVSFADLLGIPPRYSIRCPGGARMYAWRRRALFFSCVSLMCFSSFTKFLHVFFVSKHGLPQVPSLPLRSCPAFQEFRPGLLPTRIAGWPSHPASGAFMSSTWC